MKKKAFIAKWFDKLGINHVLFISNNIFHGEHIRVINYHGTPLEAMSNFEEQLKFYSKYYTSAGYNDLSNYIHTGKWEKSKPGLIISFDDGHRTNFDHAVPLLEKYGFTGWFFIPPGLIETSNLDQELFVKSGYCNESLFYEDGRYLMSWDEIRQLAKKHVIGCHTYSHHRMNINDDDKTLELEIVFSKKLLETMLSYSIHIFCWVGGEEHTYTSNAASKIKQAGYTLSFMTNTYPYHPKQSPLQIQRTNIEADYPISIVRFQLSILMDLFYRQKRIKLNRLTAV